MSDDIFADLKYMQEKGPAERMLLAIGELEANPAWRHMKAMFGRDIAAMQLGLLHELDIVKLGRLQGGVKTLTEVLDWPARQMSICKQVLERK